MFTAQASRATKGARCTGPISAAGARCTTPCVTTMPARGRSGLPRRAWSSWPRERRRSNGADGMDRAGYDHLLVEREGPLLRVSLNAPAKLNAIDFETQAELLRLFEALHRARSTSVVVLTGAGRAFSAGGDLAHNLRVAGDVALVKQEFDLARRFVNALLDVEQPIICRINGDAVGLGATLALLCDLTIAADGARIGDPHVRVGLVAGDGGALVWPLLVGYARAKQYLLGGELLPAANAQQMGLINFCVP